MHSKARAHEEIFDRVRQAKYIAEISQVSLTQAAWRETPLRAEIKRSTADAEDTMSRFQPGEIPLYTPPNKL